MICFANDTLEKSLANVAEWNFLHQRLRDEVLPALARLMKVNGTILTITSVFRSGSSDHSEGRAVDVRVWSLSPPQREAIARQMNEMFPVPAGERATVEYWHPSNSNGKYPHHYHVRVPRAVPNVG